MLRAVVWDPDLVSRRTIVSVVKLAGYEMVEQPSSAHEALDLASRVEPEVLVLVVPDDGAQWSTALADLGERAPGTTLIALSGDHDLRAKAQAAGAAAVLDPTGPRFLDHLTQMLPRPTPDRDDDGDEWLPLREAAHAAGVPLARLRHWCDRGSVPFRKEGGRRLVLVDDVRARASAEGGEAPVAPPEPVAAQPQQPEARPEPEPEPEPQPEPEPEPEREPQPEAEREPEPEPEPAAEPEPDVTVPALSWAKPEGSPSAPPRRSYDLIPDADASRRGRRRR